MSLIVLCFLHSTSVLSFYIDVALTLSTGIKFKPKGATAVSFNLRTTTKGRAYWILNVCLVTSVEWCYYWCSYFFRPTVTYCFSICCCPEFPFVLLPPVVGTKYSNSDAIPLVNKSLIWWRHQMEIFPALLALCVENSTVTGESSTQRPVTRSFDVFFDLRLNKRLNKQWWGRRFETPSCPLWRHCNVIDAILFLLFPGICVAANTKFSIGIVCQTHNYWFSYLRFLVIVLV